MNRKQYEEDLSKRQEDHRKSSYGKGWEEDNEEWTPCMHDACPQCVGTGRKKDGSACIHMISCPCRKCSPQCY